MIDFEMPEIGVGLARKKESDRKQNLTCEKDSPDRSPRRRSAGR